MRLVRHRHDPFWEVDGTAARRHRIRQRIVGFIAFVIALAAVAGSAFSWAVAVGLLSPGGGPGQVLRRTLPDTGSSMQLAITVGATGLLVLAVLIVATLTLRVIEHTRED